MTKNVIHTQTSQNVAVLTLEPLIDWIDRELLDTYQLARGKGGNALLQLRKMLSEKHLNAAVSEFYRLLPRLEKNHFLLGYRIRQWISLNFEILVSDPLGRVEPEGIAIRVKDRNLLEHRNRFVGQTDKPIDAYDLRVQIVEKRNLVHGAAKAVV